jgi:flagellar motor switch protein FliN/FliY
MDGLLSQEEINALFNSTDDDTAEETNTATSAAAGPSESLSGEEKDAIGEISNISMGSSATTLAALVNQKVDISTPSVSIVNWAQLVSSYDKPCIFIQILYKEGLDGNNILILKENDVKVIADLMMGGDGTNTSGELSDLHLSAISEAMNQMMGSASTSISSMIEAKVDITPPNATVIDMTNVEDAGKIASFLTKDFVKVSFKMTVGDLVDSELMQLYPIEFARNLYRKFVGGDQPAPAPEPAPAPQPAPQAAAAPNPGMMGQQGMAPNPGMMNMGYGMGMMPQQMQMPQMGFAMPPQADVNVSPAQFQPFMQVQSPLLQTENIDLLLDVPLEVSVELGRTSRTIKEILDFAPGTVVELNRLAGEPIDVLVNGKYVAKGEVVVIGESFGIRITEVIK